MPGGSGAEPIAGERLKAFIVHHIIIRKGTKGEVVELEVGAVRNQQQSIIAFWLKWLIQG